MSISEESKLQTAKETRKSNGMSKCDQCDFEATRAEAVKRHVKFVHEGSTEFTCSECGKRFQARWEMELHIKKKHQGYRIPCKSCEKKFYTNTMLKAHIRYVHEGIIPKCDKCDFQTNHERKLRDHKERVHEGLLFECPMCDFKGPKSLWIKSYHMRTHHEQRTKSVGTGNKQNKDDHAFEYFFCNQCDYSCKSKQGLTIHTQSKHEGIKFKCDKCDKECNTRSDLRKHMKAKNVHTGRKLKHVKLEAGEGNFNKHMKVKHPTEKKLKLNTFVKCPKCRLRYINEEKLNEHMKEKHKERNFKCDVCGRVFETESMLGEHVATKHEYLKYIKVNNVGIKDEEIKTESKTFSEMKEIIAKVEGVQYPCHLCDLEFMSPSELKTHIAIHLKVNNIRALRKVSI